MSLPTYRSYQLRYNTGFVGVYWDYRYIECFKDTKLAKAFIDERIAQRLISLIKLESAAKWDRASSFFYGESYYPHKEYMAAGETYFELRQEACSERELDVVRSIDAMLEDTFCFEDGYYRASEYLEFDRCSAEIMAQEKAKEQYYIDLADKRRIKLAQKAEKVKLQLDAFPTPRLYNDLLGLPKPLLTALADFETDYVDVLESEDELIEGRTSGHHVEVRDIMKSALNGKAFDPGIADIYLASDGELCFDLQSRLEAIAS